MSQPLPPDFSPFESIQTPPPAPVRKRSGVRTVVITLILILAVAVLLNESVFRIHNVAVVGNRSISWAEVVKAAGLNGSVSYFSLNEKKIAAGIEGNRYLVFERMEKEFPDTVILYVRERYAVANVQVMGVTFQLDGEGLVLERLGNVQPDNDLITVTGFQAREVRVGSMIVPGLASQLEAYRLLIQELGLQGFSSQVSELNLSNSDSLYLITVDGYTAHLGDVSDLRAKIGTVRAVVDKLREMGKNGGVIEASVPAVATYTPSEL